MRHSFIISGFFLMVICIPVLNAQPFSPPQILHQHSTNLVAGKIITTDLNGDGRLDILVSGSDPNVAWFRQEANGSFSSSIDIYDEEIFGEAVDAADLDGDGDMDIVVATSFGTQLAWIENLGQENFAAAQLITEMEYPIDDMILVDLDEDGQRDILVSSYSAVDKLGAVHWLRNQGHGSFAFPNPITEEAREVKKLETADINNDGRIDVILASYWDFRFVWHENLGAGTFSDAHFVRPVEDSIYNHGVVALDIDQDGDMDLVNARVVKPLTTWLENDGSGNFLAEYTILHDDGGWDIATGDFNMDGFPDLVTGLSAADQTVIFYNTGEKSFSPPDPIANSQSVPNDVFVSDVDGDYDPEIFIATTLDRRYMYIEDYRINCTPPVSEADIEICKGESIDVGLLTLSHPGTYIHAVPNPPACDSVYIVNLTVTESYLISLTDTLQEGVPYVLPDGETTTDAGEYIFELTSAAGCDSTIVVQLFPDPFTSDHSPLSEIGFSVSPNPAADILILQTQNIAIGNLWYLVDAVGRFCLSGKIETETQQIDIRGLAPGIYTLLVTREGKLYSPSNRIIRMER